jgi:exosortase
MSSPTATRPIGLGAGRPSDASLVMGPGEQRSTMVALVASIAVLIGVYWNMFALTKDYWSDDTYSHGWIIPFIAIFLLWSQRTPLGGPIDRNQENQNLMQVGIPLAAAIGCYFLGLYGIGWLAYAIAVVVALAVVFRFHEFEPIAMHERWIGVGLIVAALFVRIYAAKVDTMPFDRISFIVALYGVFMLAGGWAIVRQMWASIGFFIFMFPLPSVVENHFLAWLQKGAAVASTAVLQVMGVVAYRKGYTIHVEGLEDQLEVAQACSGLRMLTIFSAMAIAMVLLIERPWWDKLIMLLSAIPIALATNVIRITATALLYKAVEGTSMEETLHGIIHDYAGYAMIFVAGGIMWLEYKILTWLFVEEGDEGMQAAGIRGTIPTPRH